MITEQDKLDIFKIPPIDTGSSNPVEVHMLLGEAHFLRAVWAVKSLYISAKIHPYVVFHNDGTLSEASKVKLKEQFIGCRLIEKSDADTVILPKLEAYPKLYTYREDNKIALKVFDYIEYANKDYILCLDSDVLWYNESNIISQYISYKVPFYWDAGADGCVLKAEYMSEHMNLTPAKNFNAGIMGIPIQENLLDFSFLEGMLSAMYKAPPFILKDGFICTTIGLSGRHSDMLIDSFFFDQTIWAVLYELKLKNYRVLPFNGHLKEYKWCLPRHAYKLNSSTVFYHHVWDSKYNTFFDIGVRYLIDNGFLNI